MRRLNPSASKFARRAPRCLLEACEPRRLMASVSGLVYADANANGRRDSGEAGVAFQRVFVDSNDNGRLNAGERYAETDAQGRYTIAGIPVDGRSVRIRVSSFAYAVTAPAGGAHSMKFAGEYAGNNRDFGIAIPSATSSVGVTPFIDRNNNGSPDAGDAKPSVLDAWFDFDQDDLHDANEPTLAAGPSAVPSAGGVTFPTYYGQLPPADSYWLAFRLAGDKDLFADHVQGIAGPTPPQGVAMSLRIPYPVATGPTGSVRGTVYGDANANGARDAFEAPSHHVTVFADLNGNGLMEYVEPAAKTRADGSYEISGIPVSSNAVTIRVWDVPASDVSAPAGGTHAVKVSAAGAVAAGRDFGLSVPTGSTGISVYVFEDVDGDGLRGASETGPADGTVWVDLNRNGRREAIEPLLKVVGDANNGDARGPLPIFATGIAPGSYRLALRRAGDADDVADYTMDYVVGPAPLFADFALKQKTGSVQGRLFTDYNGDGKFNGGDQPLAGRGVYADLNYNGVFDVGEPRATSGSDGRYTLIGLPSTGKSVAIRLLGTPASQVTGPAGGAHSLKFGSAYLAGGRDFGVKP